MKLSYTALGDYIFCPYYFWLKRVKKIKAPSTLEAVFGLAIHRIIHSFLYRIKDLPAARLKRMDKGEHIVFFYKEAGGLINTWLKLWQEYMGEAKPELVPAKDRPEIWFPEDMPAEARKDRKEMFMKTGINILQTYYYLNYDKPTPFLLEKELTIPVSSLDLSLKDLAGVEMNVKIDQARRDRRGRVYIVDIKTGWDSFLNPKREPSSLKEQKRVLQEAIRRRQTGKPNYRPLPTQASLVFNLQLTIYHLLFKAWFGYAPYKVGLHYLRNDHLYLTEITQGHIEEVKEHLKYFLDALESESFPKLGIKNRNCRYCTLRKMCLGEGRRLIEPVSIVKVEEFPVLPEEVRAEIEESLSGRPKELKLELKRKSDKKQKRNPKS